MSDKNLNNVIYKLKCGYAIVDKLDGTYHLINQKGITENVLNDDFMMEMDGLAEIKKGSGVKWGINGNNVYYWNNTEEKLREPFENDFANINYPDYDKGMDFDGYYGNDILTFDTYQNMNEGLKLLEEYWIPCQKMSNLKIKFDSELCMNAASKLFSLNDINTIENHSAAKKLAKIITETAKDYENVTCDIIELIEKICSENNCNEYVLRKSFKINYQTTPENFWEENLANNSEVFEKNEIKRLAGIKETIDTNDDERVFDNFADAKKESIKIYVHNNKIFVVAKDPRGKFNLIPKDEVKHMKVHVDVVFDPMSTKF